MNLSTEQKQQLEAKLADAIAHCEQAKHVSDTVQEANWQREAAVFLVPLGKGEQAANRLRRALELVRHDQRGQEEAEILCALGMIEAQVLDKPGKAWRYLEAALDKAQALTDSRLEARILVQLA